MGSSVGEGTAGLPGQTYRQREESRRRAHECEERWERHKTLPDWLAGLGWQWFVTFTFRHRHRWTDSKLWHTEHDPQKREERFKGRKPGKLLAGKLLRKALNGLNRSLFGKRYRKRGQGLTLFLAWEPHQDGTVHAHGLVRGFPEHQLPKWDHLKLNDFFWSRTGIARWFRIDEDQYQRARYVAKYVTKAGNEDEWEILGPTNPEEQRLLRLSLPSARSRGAEGG